MGTYPYTRLGSGIPAIPIVPVELATPGLAPLRRLACQAILDTGSDCTLVPLPLLMRVNAQVADRSTKIAVGGRLAVAIPHEVGISIDRHTQLVFRVFGCPVDDIGDLLLIGRDWMNLYHIEFKGPDLTFTIF